MNEHVYLEIQCYLSSTEQKQRLLTLYIQSQFWVSVIESANTCPHHQKLWENPANCKPKNWYSCQIVHFVLEEITLLCLQIGKMEQLDCKRLLLETLLTRVFRCWDSERSKNIAIKFFIQVSFVQKFLGSCL